MQDRNNPPQSNTGFLKPLIIAAVIIAVAWVLGKGILTLISLAKQV